MSNTPEKTSPLCALGSTPPVIVALDPLGTCGRMDPTPMIFGWSRAFPVNHIGDF